MKKKHVFTVLIALCMALLFSISAAADGMDTYYLEELDMSVKIPSDLWVITRKSGADDPTVITFGLDENISEYLEENSIYLNGWNMAVDYEFMITMTDNNMVKDMKDMAGGYLDELKGALTSTFTAIGAEVTNIDTYENEQAFFFVIDYVHEVEGGEAHSKQWYTIVNNQAINFTLNSYQGEVTEEEAELIQAMADSARFGKDAEEENISGKESEKETETETETETEETETEAPEETEGAEAEDRDDKGEAGASANESTRLFVLIAGAAVLLLLAAIITVIVVSSKKKKA